jgi:nitrite reductase (NO-forming)
MKHTDPLSDAANHDVTLSRRNLLKSSAGLAMAGTLLATGQAAAQHSHAGHGASATPSPGGSLSNRIYQVVDGLTDIGKNPTDIPGPITRKEPQTVKVELETIELEARLDGRTTYHYWTFNGTVPGPFVRVRVGDTVEVTLKNADNSSMMHNVDFHAVNGPGGGAGATSAAPGETKGFTFKALNPGTYVYHCAVPPVAMHIANGMYGLILVEPENGMPPVDREFYVMQGEIYTEEAFGSSGLLTESYEKLLNERPEYFVLNGHVGSLTEHNPLKAKVGETVRIYFGVGGPNFTSSFHVIGEIFDRVYNLGSITSEPLKDVQTITVPAGGAAIVEFKVEVPGRYVLVDHALSRVERGLAGFLIVEGDDNHEVFHATENAE